MKPLTPTRRAEIYREAAEKIERIRNSKTIMSSCKYAFCCNVIENITPILCEKNNFPEFFLFKNRRRGINYAWWDLGGYELQPRILALLLSAEIALNP